VINSVEIYILKTMIHYTNYVGKDYVLI